MPVEYNMTDYFSSNLSERVYNNNMWMFVAMDTKFT